MFKLAHVTDPHFRGFHGLALSDFTGKRVVGAINLLVNRTRKHKMALLEAGLGVGSMPRHLVDEAVARGRLRLLPSVADDHAAMTMVVAWRPRTGGKARQWLLRHLPEAFGG